MTKQPNTGSRAMAQSLPAASRMAVVGRAMAAVGRVAGRIMEGIEYRRTVAALSRLDERTLRDIGMSRMDIHYRAREAVRGGRR